MNTLVRKDCPWVKIGENTGGGVFWCEDCGSIIDEDGTNLENPSWFGLEVETRLCKDQGHSA